MIRRLGIIGAGGHGKVIADTAERTGWSEIVFFDPRFDSSNLSHAHWPLVGVPEDAKFQCCDGYFVAIGSSKPRQEWMEWLERNGLPLVSLVDPTAVVSRYARLEVGVLIVAGSVVNADAFVGRGSIINTRAVVDHDCQIGMYTHICPGVSLAGNVSVGDHAWVGIGSQIRQGVKIGCNATVGAGATVISDIEDGWTVVGTPARPC